MSAATQTPGNNTEAETEAAKGASCAPMHGTIDSRILFNGANTVVILHADTRYVLRLTRENKLILTK